MLIRRGTLDKIGDIGCIQNELIHDCSLAKCINPHGKIWLGLTKDSTSLRGYSKFLDGWNTIARTAYTQLSYSKLKLVSCIIGLILLFVIPPVFTFWAFFPANLLGLVSWLIMTATYLPILHRYRLWWIWAIFLPFITLLYLGATIHSSIRYMFGSGSSWKGRKHAR